MRQHPQRPAEHQTIEARQAADDMLRMFRYQLIHGVPLPLVLVLLAQTTLATGDWNAVPRLVAANGRAMLQR